MNQVNKGTSQQNPNNKDALNYSPLEGLKDGPEQNLGVGKHKNGSIIKGQKRLEILNKLNGYVKKDQMLRNKFAGTHALSRKLFLIFLHQNVFKDIVSQMEEDKTHNGRTPLESVYIQKEKPRLPDDIQDKMRNTISTKKKKSFKIRQMRKEMDQPFKERALTEQKVTVDIKQDEKQKKISKTLKNKQKLIHKLQQIQKIFAINGNYKEILLDLIQKSTHKRHKSVRTIIEKQIETIGTEKNIYKKLQKMVQTRRAMLSHIKNGNQGIKLNIYIDFQMHSLTLIEQILKFKSFWQAIYYDHLHHPTKINFYYDQSNYLACLTEEVRQLDEGDPFLVARTTKLHKDNQERKQEQIRERKEMTLKIRACQLLLIEQQLLAAQ